MKSYATKSSLLSDNDYIHGLKSLDNRVTHQFFYKECYFLHRETKCFFKMRKYSANLLKFK